MIARCQSDLLPLFEHLPRDMRSAVDGIAENAAKLCGYFNVVQPGWREEVTEKPAIGRGLSHLESAVAQAAAMLDLLMAKVVEEDRAGAIEYNQSPWVGNLASLVAHVEGNLHEAFYDYHKSLRVASGEHARA